LHLPNLIHIKFDYSMAPKLRKVEKEILIPRYLELKINTELCHNEFADFMKCAKEKNFRLVTDCKDIYKVFGACSNRWFNDDELKKQVEQEYLEKKKRFKETGERTKSPFTRL